MCATLPCILSYSLPAFRSALLALLVAPLFIASSCSRSQQSSGENPVVPDTQVQNSVLDTGWRQTGYRTPPMSYLLWLQRVGSTLVAIDSSDAIHAYRQDKGWWEVPKPAGYDTRSYKSYIGIGDSLYMGGLGRNGFTWDPVSEQFTSWTIPGTPNHPDSAWIQGLGTYKGNLVASVRVVSWTKPSEEWIRIDGIWRPFGVVKGMLGGNFDVFYEASDGTMFAGCRNGLYYLASDSVWTEITPLMSCSKPSCAIIGVTGITEYEGKGWVTTQGAFVATFDVASRTYIDTVQEYRAVADSVYRFPAFGTFFGMLHYKDLLFVPGAELAPGVWVWNRNRKWFQHVPMLRKGVTYYTNNFASTYGLAVLDDTLYASNSHGVVKFAIADIEADLARDTLPWPGTP